MHATLPSLRACAFSAIAVFLVAGLAGCDETEKERYVKKRASTCEELLDEYIIESGNRHYDEIKLSRGQQNQIYRMCVKREPGYSVVWYGWRKKTIAE